MQIGRIQQVENVVDIEIDEQTVTKAAAETTTPVEVRESVDA